MSILKLNRVSLFYTDSADDSPKGSSKPSILFVNGWALSSRYWNPLIRSLSQASETKYRFVQHDHSGTGKSTRLKTDTSAVTIDDFIDESVALITHLGLGLNAPLHIIGHSMGSIIAAGIATRLQEKLLPNQVTSLSIVACGIFNYSAVQMGILSTFVKTSISLKFLFHLDFFRRSFIEKATCKPIPKEYEAVIVNDFLEAESAATETVGTASLDPIILASYRHHVLNFPGPLFLSVGTLDKTIPPEGMTTLYRTRLTHTEFPTRFSPFEGIGHLPMLECTEAFSHAFASHLASANLLFNPHLSPSTLPKSESPSENLLL